MFERFDVSADEEVVGWRPHLVAPDRPTLEPFRDEPIRMTLGDCGGTVPDDLVVDERIVAPTVVGVDELDVSAIDSDDVAELVAAAPQLGGSPEELKHGSVPGRSAP